MSEPPGADDPTLDPPPETEEEEVERRRRITIAEVVVWYQRRGLPLDAELQDWSPDAIDG
jgi:hypothetical protein